MICPLLYARAHGEPRADAPTRGWAAMDHRPHRARREVRSGELEAAREPSLDDSGERVAAACLEPAATVRAAPNRVRAVEMPPDDDMPAGTARPAGLFGELQPDTVEHDGIVLAYDAPFFFAEDLLQVDRPEWDERRRGVGGRPCERGVVRRDELLPQIGVGRLEGVDPRAAEFVDEAILQGAIEPLAPPARLRRIGADVLDAQSGQRAPDVREVVAIDGAAGLGRVEGPAGAIRIECHWQPARAQHMSEGVHHRLQGLARPELRIEQMLGGVIEDGDEGLALRRREGEPAVRAAVEMQQLAVAGTRLAPAPSAAAGAALGDEPRGLQREFDEGVRKGHAVIPSGQLVKVPHIEPGVRLAIEVQDALHLGARGREMRGTPPAAIE